jgi:hypothetical protein
MDAKTRSPQEGSELNKKVLVQHNWDACFSNQYVCGTHHKDSTIQPQQDTDICSSKRKKPTLRNNDFFMGID